MRLVIVESPYAGDIEANVTCACAMHSRGARRRLRATCHTQPDILRDEVPAGREQGIAAALAWYRAADATVWFSMEAGITAAKGAGKPVGFRMLSNADVIPRAP